MPFAPARAVPPYVADRARYERMPYRRVGVSGVQLPAISLGLWQNFGDDRPLAGNRSILRRAFDLGVTHFDLANNYGPPYGAAELNFGRIFSEDFRPYRDELIISTKAGYDQWPGPYGEFGSRKYLLASLEQSLSRMGLDYLDIFYSHRFDPHTPLRETMGALDSAVRQGKALYVGISSYSAQRTEEAVEILTGLGTPLLIHQPSYSLLNRWIERGLLAALERHGVGSIVFSPLGQGLLTDRYLHGVPEDSRVRRGEAFDERLLSEETLARVSALNEIATVDSPTVDLDLALACFDGENTAAERFADARGRRGADPPWISEVGFVEHHHNGHLILRGTFAGHYVDVDESDHVSQKGAGEGAIAGGLVGTLLGPPGIALGLLIGGLVGSQVGESSETEPEPQALADRLRDLVPRSCSAIAMIAPAGDVDEMLSAIGERALSASRRPVTGEQAAALEASLSATPRASPPPRENPA